LFDGRYVIDEFSILTLSFFELLQDVFAFLELAA